MATGKKFDWIPMYIHRAKGSKSWRLPDFQWCWYWKLLIESADAEMLGYLPNDISVLWRLAGAMTQGYFEKRGGLGIINCHFRRTEDGLWIYNPTLLNILAEQSTKLRRNPQDVSVVPLSVSVVAFDELLKAVQRLFSFYVNVCERDSRYKLTEQRQKKCVLRLQELMRDNGGDLAKAESAAHEAIEKLSKSQWHMQEGHVDWLEQIFRSEDEFQKRLTMKVNGNGKQAKKSNLDQVFGTNGEGVDDGDGGKTSSQQTRPIGPRTNGLRAAAQGEAGGTRGAGLHGDHEPGHNGMYVLPDADLERD